MIINVIGKKKTCFTDDKGNERKFWKVYAVHKAPYSDDINEYEGEACSEFSLPAEIFDLVTVGRKYSADFDVKGKLLDFSEV